MLWVYRVAIKCGVAVVITAESVAYSLATFPVVTEKDQLEGQETTVVFRGDGHKFCLFFAFPLWLGFPSLTSLNFPLCI